MDSRIGLGVRALGLAFFCGTLLSACVQTQASGPPVELVGSQWMRIDDENASPHFPTLAFDAGGASGYSGCRGWAARIRTSQTRIVFFDIRTNHRCEAAPARAAEANFMRALTRARAIVRDGDELTMRDAAGRDVARFVRGD